ncbi:MAG TPA: hypothetical protein VF538_08695 [Pyrinomonadaceae bacterium]|jgi:hypothetical protein
MAVLLLAALPIMAQTDRLAGVPTQKIAQSYEERIARALRIEVPANRDQELIKVAFDQAKSGQYADAKNTIWSYVENKDWGFASLVTAGVGNGLYEDAMSALALIENAELRAIGFKQVAEAQAKSGDVTGARQTLLAGLDDALKGEKISDRRFTMHHIVEGMAAAGLTDDMRNTLRLFEASDLHGGYLAAAIVQAQRGDVEEAKWTIRQAVKLAQEDNEWADSRLAQIVAVQVDAGFLKDARETAAMIKNVSLKRSATRSISLAENKRKE